MVKLIMIVPVCLIDITGTIIANKMVAAGYGLLLTSFFFNAFIFQRPYFLTLAPKALSSLGGITI